jgi:hypothetical protein
MGFHGGRKVSRYLLETDSNFIISSAPELKPIRDYKTAQIKLVPNGQQ